jgi:penicillin amidase
MQYREVDTIRGVLAWNRAATGQDIIDSIPDLTWNENIAWADSQGHIGWWHPGLHRRKAPGADVRLPLPGTGEYDNGDFLPVDALPHLVDPPRGWVSNWNNKPAQGWLDSGGQSETSEPAGIDGRAATLADTISSRDDWTFDRLIELDRRVSSLDFRTRHLLPMLLHLRERDDLTDLEREALDVLAAWDGSANGPGADMEFAGYDAGDEPTTVGAAPTIFDTFADRLVEDLLGFLRHPTYTEADGTWTFDLVGRQSQMGRHVYDMSPPLHLALRVLDPSTSTLTTTYDYARGRTRDEILLDVLGATVDTLAAAQGDDPSAWRMTYSDPSDDVCNPSGAVGPCGVMPFLERGTWIHYVGWAPAATDVTVAPTPGVSPAPRPGGGAGSLPSTGGGFGMLALVTLAAADRMRRTRRP